MPVQDRPVRANHDNSIEKSCATELTIALVDPKDYRHTMLGSRILNRLQIVTGKIYRVFAQPLVDFGGKCHVTAGS
jgi:hypothetical protein